MLLAVLCQHTHQHQHQHWKRREERNHKVLNLNNLIEPVSQVLVLFIFLLFQCQLTRFSSPWRLFLEFRVKAANLVVFILCSTGSNLNWAELWVEKISYLCLRRLALECLDSGVVISWKDGFRRRRWKLVARSLQCVCPQLKVNTHTHLSLDYAQ